MLLNTRYMVPKTYANSRDYQILLKLLELVVNAAKTDADLFPSLIDPNKCPDNLLPLLADYVGYDYDAGESINSNRAIIKYYPYLIRNRGSYTGFKLASALASRVAEQSNSAIDPLSGFNVFQDETTGYIYICVYDPAALPKIHDLLEVVRPAGVGLQVVLTHPVNQTDKVDISDKVIYKKYTHKTGFIGDGSYSTSTSGYTNQIPYDGTYDEFSDPQIANRQYSAIIGLSEINEVN